MKISICIGSSCHLKGSRQVIEEFKTMIADKDLSGKIELAGTFCMNDCKNGVCVTIDDESFSVKPESAVSFFEAEVMSRL